jgi:glycosyl transferase family 25
MKQFDQLYYINLEYRLDMYDSINNVIDNLQFDRNKVTRINAIKKNNGAYGCALSHIEALEDAKKNCYEKILILEDDFVPFDYNDTKYKISKFLDEVKDWDLIMLSSSRIMQVNDSQYDNVQKVIDCQGTIAYAITSDFIDTLLETFKKSSDLLSTIENYAEPCPYCIDVFWKHLQPNSNWYIFNPILGKEFPKYSDVQKRFLDHFEIKK